MKLWYGILILLVICIMAAGCVQPPANVTPTPTPAETPMETPIETATPTMNVTPTETGVQFQFR